MSFEMTHTCIDCVEVTVTFTVEGSYHKGASEYGRPLEPDSYPEIEIESICDCDGEYEVSSEDIDEIIDHAYEYLEESKGDAMISAWEAKHYEY